MSITRTRRPRRPLSTIDRGILALHGVTAVVVGIIAFLGANDPDWGDLQRIVVVMMIGLWAGGIATMAMIAQLVANRWLRYGILLAGPFIGLAVLIGRSALGWI